MKRLWAVSKLVPVTLCLFASAAWAVDVRDDTIGDALDPAGLARSAQCQPTDSREATCADDLRGSDRTLASDDACDFGPDGLSARGAHPPDATTTCWDRIVAKIFEDTPLVYPDTQAAYLMKHVPLRTDVAYKLTFTLPYATYSSFTTYQDTKPFAYIKESDYILTPVNGVTPANPYQPGNAVMTPRGQRQIELYVTPDYEAAVAQDVKNILGIGTTATANVIFGRVYYPNRNNPDTGRRFVASSTYDRLGYTLPPRIQCVRPDSLTTPTRCPRFRPLASLPLIDFNVGRPAPPQPPANCPNRMRWDLPQLKYVHWGGPGELTNTGQAPPDPETTCSSYLMSMLFEPENRAVLTYIQSPPTFFDVSALRRRSRFPDPAPDVRYAGIQNYGTEGSDVRYNQQSRSVEEIKTWPDNRPGQSWIFLHYTRPIDPTDRATIIAWGNRQNINVNQLAIWTEHSPHPPFLIYRIKEASSSFAQTDGYFPDSVPCFSAAQGVWTDSPISNAADGTNMGPHVPITVTCTINPGQLTPADLDACLRTLLATNPDWGPNGANCTP